MTIQLGDKVRDKHSGFTGTAVARTEFINGCIQINVLPKCDKQNTIPEELSIDEGCLEVISTKKKTIKKTKNGGPMHKGFKMRGY